MPHPEAKPFNNNAIFYVLWRSMIATATKLLSLLVHFPR
jgi:hypothetical protein